MVALALAGCPRDPSPDVVEDVPVVDTTPPPRDQVDVPRMDVPPDMPQPPPPDVIPSDGGTEACAPIEEDPAGATWCSMGTDVPGVTVPAGFCVRRYAMVNSPRVMTFACNGDLFVSAPMAGAPGGSGGGPAAVVVLSDDNRDGVAEQSMFATRVPDVHGVAIGGGHVYFTTQGTVFRTPYTLGQRTETPGARVDLQMPGRWGTGGRWTHGLARSVTGRLLGSRGEYGACGGTPIGEIATVGMGRLDTVATGFRNPMYLRCHFRDDVCLAAELGEDQTPGAREKLVLIPGGSTSFGYPCCFARNLPATPQCGSIPLGEFEYRIGDTPFGFDWERGRWPAPFRDMLFVALHGSFYTSPPWEGAGIVMLATDPATHLPVERPSDPPVMAVPAQPPTRYFISGFGITSPALRRPADITFSPDGRMFFADDIGNAIYWVAPNTLRVPRPR